MCFHFQNFGMGTIFSKLIIDPLFSGQNVDSMIFKEVMHELARKLGHLGKDFGDGWQNGDVS